ADVEALAADRVVHVRGVTREQHSTLPVGRRLPGHVREPGDPARAVHPEVRSPHGDERLAEVAQGRLAVLAGVPLGDHEPHPLPVVERAQAVLAVGVAADAPLRLLAHLGLGQQRADRGIPAREVDAGRLADHAAAAVAADEVLGPQRLAVRELDVDAGVVLREAGDLAPTLDLHPELVDPAGQDLLEALLHEREPVGVPAGEVADVEAYPGEARDLSRVTLREEPLGDATLIEHLDRAGVQAARSGALQLLVGAPFDDDDVDVGERQLGRQHHPRRTCSGYGHRMHLVPPIWLAARDYGARTNSLSWL